ncbi:MAG TPA: glycoside hydrolase family 3 N-terminal domain-containing protein [Thermoanaerobaculia bacterium]|nr:glycoside hydrolase family 3 N-terminal domain-containing protein [Thermoanaerobaculia bacterium]
MREEAAKALCVGIPGQELDDEMARLLADLQPGGVILLPRNVESEGQLRELVAAVRRAVPGALLYLDAEGGRVDRLRSLVGPAPSGAALAASPPRVARTAGRWVGAALRCFGFDVDLAPVVDIDHGQADNALDRRYLGAHPRAVVARAGAFLDGLHGAGTSGCLKHFPGLGAAGQDTHYEGSVVPLSARRLERDLAPFARLGQAAGAIMASHAAYPALDPEGRPATLSPPIATGLLRGRLDFRGLLFSDDLDMKALEPWGDLPERAAASFAAGCDAIFVCWSPQEAPAMAEKLSAPGLAGRLTEALGRIETWRARVRRLAAAAPVPSLDQVRRGLERVRRAAGE